MKNETSLGRTLYHGALTIALGLAISLALGQVGHSQAVATEPTSVTTVGPEGAYASTGVMSTRYGSYQADHPQGLLNWDFMSHQPIVLHSRRFGFYRRPQPTVVEQELARLDRGGLPVARPFANNPRAPRL